MSRILVASAIALGLCAAAPRSFAQCPPAPGAGVRYSEPFYQAQKTFLEAARAAAAQLGVKLRDLPVPIGGAQLPAAELQSLAVVSVDQAYEHIRDELSTQRSALMAECSAALCQATAGKSPLKKADAALRAQALASICRDALHIGGGGFSASQVLAMPSPLMVIFKEKEAERTVNVHLANLTAAPVALRIDEPDGLTPDERTTMPALFAGRAQKKRFQLAPRKAIALPFVVRKPEGGQGPQVVSVDFVTEPDGAVATSVTFYLVPSADGAVPPPEISCGVANPRAHIKAMADNDRTYEEAHATPTTLTSGVEVKGRTEWIWKNNGGGGGRAEYRMYCTQASSGAVRFEFTGTAGGRCARTGTNKGGQGHSDPHWRTQVALSGVSGTKWTIRMTARGRRAVQNGVCKLVIGTESTPLALDGSPVTFEKKDLPPGRYAIELDCTGEDIGCFGGTEYQWVTGADDIRVDVEAARQ